MVKKLKISAVRESSKAKYSAVNKGEFNGTIFKAITWFEDRSFIYMSDKKKKKAVLRILNRLPRSKVECSPDFDKKERVVVNIQGKYSLDESVFDEKIKIPKHLRKDKNREKGVPLRG